MKTINFNCFIDSVQIRCNNLRLEPLFDSIYGKPYIDRYSLVYTDNNNKTILFTIRTIQDRSGLNYQLLSFNGFKKYSSRDAVLNEVFNEVLQLLADNDISFFLTKVDLSIDFYNVKLEQLDIERKKGRGISRQLLSEATEQTKEDIENNTITYYFEKKSKYPDKILQRAYLYNKSKKENLDSNIYRFEVEMKRFNKIEYYSIKEYKQLLKQNIKDRFNKYSVKCDDIPIEFDFALIEPIIEKCNRI